MKYFLLISCLILCSCFSEEEVALENSSSSSIDSELSIFDCPSEDVAEYPIPDEPIPPSLSPSGEVLSGWCGMPLKLSMEKILFDAQRGVRCVATTGFMYVAGVDCRSESAVVSGGEQFKREICSWVTVTKIDDYTLHISVNKNETGKEREKVMSISTGICNNSFTITQSAN